MHGTHIHTQKDMNIKASLGQSNIYETGVIVTHKTKVEQN